MATYDWLIGPNIYQLQYTNFLQSNIYISCFFFFIRNAHIYNIIFYLGINVYLLGVSKHGNGSGNWHSRSNSRKGAGMPPLSRSLSPSRRERDFPGTGFPGNGSRISRLYNQFTQLLQIEREEVEQEGLVLTPLLHLQA